MNDTSSPHWARRALLVATLCTAGCSSPSDPIVIEAPVVDAAMIDSGDDSGLPDAAVSEPDAGADIGVERQPEPPQALTRWLTGDEADVDVQPAGPGLILMGGGSEPDAAFDWWVPKLAGGDVVVLRVSGSDGYNDYLYSDIGGIDSVETLRVDTRALADDPYVAWRIDHAEGVFLAGGNQWDYLSLWSNTALQRALQRVHERGAVLGGTSAGLAVLGDRAFSAENDTVYSEEALADPFNEFMRFDDEFLSLPALAGVVTDSHFAQRDRMGRLVSFVARMWTDGFTAPVGIGVDESTALLITPEGREVVGSGAVYEVSATTAPAVCEAGLPLQWVAIDVVKTTRTGSEPLTVSVADGVLSPASPY